MVKYIYSRSDKSGYVYSIDDCIFEYSLKMPTYKDIFIDYLSSIAKRHNLTDEYWERRDLKPCSKFDFCSDVVHLCKGINLNIGKWNYVKGCKDAIWVPKIRLKINLNKHGEKAIFSDLNDWLKTYCISCYLIKYDVAVDVPCRPDDIEVLKTQKEKGLYKGTRYYGQRNKHGYCKIYDKGKESDLVTDLTRIEHTFDYRKNMNFEKVYVKKYSIVDEKMIDTDKVIIEMALALKVYKEDISKYLDNLGRRKKEKILKLLNGCEYQEIEFDIQIVKDLLEDIRLLIGFKEYEKPVFVDSQGFMQLSENVDIPFE